MLGWVVSVAFTAGAWDELRSSNITPVGQPFDAADRTVAVLTDLPQPGRTIDCEAVGPGEKRSPITDDGIVDVTATTDGTRWHLIGLMPAGRDQMTIECQPDDGLSDSAGYGYALVGDLDTRDTPGQLLAWGSLAAGLAIIGTTAWRRRAPVADAADGT